MRQLLRLGLKVPEDAADRAKLAADHAETSAWSAAQRARLGVAEV
jgi:hypothetical protein